MKMSFCLSQSGATDGQMIIRLLDLGTGLTIHKWVPPVEEIILSLRIREAPQTVGPRIYRSCLVMAM